MVFRSQLSASGKQELEDHLNAKSKAPLNRLSDASYDIFTYHGEDGIIGYLLRHIKNIPPVFVDIGSGDCIKSNCACLAVHYGWQGVFIDSDPKQLSVGKSFYRQNKKVKFIEAEVNTENINDLLVSAGIAKNVGLLSIDIDGNDYWIWKAIDVIEPAIVVAEAKVEFGFKDAIVPYGSHNHRGADVMYNGASVKAFEKLANKKGYKLAGSNKQGYNLFFVKQTESIPVATAEDILDDKDIAACFYPDSFFKQHEFITA